MKLIRKLRFQMIPALMLLPKSTHHLLLPLGRPTYFIHYSYLKVCSYIPILSSFERTSCNTYTYTYLYKQVLEQIKEIWAQNQITKYGHGGSRSSMLPFIYYMNCWYIGKLKLNLKVHTSRQYILGQKEKIFFFSGNFHFKVSYG